jgi:hypothetical protein
LEKPLPSPDLGNREFPSGICLETGAAKGGSADQMSFDVEGIVDRRVGGEKSLG